MKEICINNIDCSSCPNMGGCNLLKHEALFQEFFTLYGSYCTEPANKTIHLYQPHPEKIHTIKEIEKRLHEADHDIEKLEKYIVMLQSYKIELVKRYNYIATAPTQKKIKLQRYKKYQGNVFYYVIVYDVDLISGHEQEAERQTFKGTERKQATAVFEQLKAQYTNAMIEIDIDKKSWEK